jgi:uncharacterized SAM-binding protein YcdF (DUF218 family)
VPIRPRSLHRTRRSGFGQNWAVWVYFPLALALCLLAVCLWKSGKWLVSDDPFEKAPWALVLAGESRDCERTDEAIKLYLDGRIDTLVLSGDRIFRTRYTSEFLVNEYVREGVPRGKIFEFHQDAYSTLEEARALIRQFRLQKLDTVVIITSNYHTARARRIYRKLAGGFPHIIVHAAPYHAFDPASWWSSRESCKIWFEEWVRVLYGWWELLRATPETGKAEYQNLVPDIWSSRGGPGAPEPAEPARPQEAEPDKAAPPADTVKGASHADTAKTAAISDTVRDSSQAAKPMAAEGAADHPAAPVTDTLRNRADTAAAIPADSAAHAKPHPAKPAAPPKPPKTSKDSAKKTPEKKAEKPKKKNG